MLKEMGQSRQMVGLMDVQLGHRASSGFCIPTVLGQEPGPGASQQGPQGIYLAQLSAEEFLEIKPDPQTQPPIMYFQGSGS